ncbi:MAG: hypothetical protein ACREJX_02370, partial [Polyangiaceae bacterium]
LYLATKDPARLKDGRAELLISRFGSSRTPSHQALIDLRHLGDLGRHAILRFGEEAVMKVYHRVDDGLSTELELGRVLNSKEGSVAPILRNAVEARYGRGEPQTIALVHDFVPNVGTGWSIAIDELGRFYDRVLARPADEAIPEAHAGTPLSLMGTDPPPLVAAQMGGFRTTLAQLGPVIAEIHTTLAANVNDPAFAPEPYSTLDRRSKYQSLRNIAGKVLRELREKMPTFSERTRREAEAVLSLEADLFRSFEPLLHTKLGALRIRVHGNLHLGNVLYTGRTFVVIGAGAGEERSVSERRRKRSALRDLAGMVRSIEYAAVKVLTDPSRVRASDFDRAARWAFLWSSWMSAAFLQAYFLSMGPSPIITPSLDETAVLFDAFVFERTLYQIQAELDAHPDGVLVPLLALRRLLGK